MNQPLLPDDGQHDPELEELVRKHFENYDNSNNPKNVQAVREQNPLASVQEEIRCKIEFRLANTDEDLQSVLDVERTLVIDPASLKRAFEAVRQMRAEGATTEQIVTFMASPHSPFLFESLGGHISANTLEILRQVRQKGWVILAGIADEEKNFHPVGFNYGLNTMPSGTREGDPFHMLSLDTIQAHKREKAKIRPKESAFNWRTGILEEIDMDILGKAGINVPVDVVKNGKVSLRRMGIASALKYLIASLAKKNGRDLMYFNIATIYDDKAKSNERIRNTPSYNHNIRYFNDDLGYRKGSTFIWMENEQGEKEKVGEALWRVRGDELNDVLHNLRSEKSVLKTRNWDIESLEKTATSFYDQLNADGHVKDIQG